MDLTTVDLPCATCPMVPDGGAPSLWVRRNVHGGLPDALRSGAGRHERWLQARPSEARSAKKEVEAEAEAEAVAGAAGRHGRAAPRTDVDRRLARDDLGRERVEGGDVEGGEVLLGQAWLVCRHAGRLCLGCDTRRGALRENSSFLDESG